MKKYLLALCLGTLAVIGGGCGNTGLTGSTIFTISDIDTISAGQTKQVQGSVQAPNTLSLSFAILDSIRDTVTNGTVSCTSTGVSGKSTIDLQADANLTIVTQSTALSGTYYLQISASSGSENVITQVSFVIIGGSTSTLSQQTFTVGTLQTVSAACLLDADNMATYIDTISNPSVEAKIDAVFSDSLGVLSMESPATEQVLPFTGWAIKASTQYKDVSSTANFSAITTQTQIDSLWGTGSGVSTLSLSSGQTIVILTNTGAYKLIQIESISGTGTNLSINIEGKY